MTKSRGCATAANNQHNRHRKGPPKRAFCCFGGANPALHVGGTLRRIVGIGRLVIFRLRFELFASEVAIDQEVANFIGGELEIVQRHGNALFADAQEAAEVDQHGIDLAVLGEQDIANHGNVLAIRTNNGGTGQVFLFGEYSNGSNVLLGSQATYAILTGGGGFASVSPNGTVSGLSVGTTQLLASFSGQTLNIPLAVVTPGTQNYTSIQVTNTTKPIPVTAGNPVQINTSGTTSGGNVFGLNASTLTYTLSNTTDFSVTNGGQVSVNTGVAAGTTATVTVSFTNPNTTTVTTTVNVVVGQ